MPMMSRTDKEYYSPQEAAVALNISLDRLNFLLNKHVFNDGAERPAEITFQSRDLIMISFWDRGTDDGKVVRMPKR
jgi:hypothetical protein